jgi:hypothetical protein
VLNLARFISVIKFRPLTWRTAHPYLLTDRFEVGIRCGREGCHQLSTKINNVHTLHAQDNVPGPWVEILSCGSPKNAVGKPCCESKEGMPCHDAQKLRMLIT